MGLKKSWSKQGFTLRFQLFKRHLSQAVPKRRLFWSPTNNNRLDLLCVSQKYRDSFGPEKLFYLHNVHNQKFNFNNSKT